MEGQSLSYLHPNSYMSGRPNIRRGFGGQYNREEKITHKKDIDDGIENRNSQIMYLQNPINIVPYTYDLPKNISKPVDVKWFEKTSRCDHIEQRCSKLMNTALKKILIMKRFQPELLITIMTTCGTSEGSRDCPLVKQLKKILNIIDECESEKLSEPYQNDACENYDHFQPLTIEHLRSASDPSTYRSLLTPMETLPLMSTSRNQNIPSCDSSCNTSSTSSVEGSKFELSLGSDELTDRSMTCHELNTVLRRLHRCIILRLAARKQNLSNYHQEMNNLENSLRKIQAYIPDNFMLGNQISNSEDTKKNRNSIYNIDDDSSIGNSPTHMRAGQRVAKTTSIRFERLCSDIDGVIKLLCQLGRRKVLFEIKKDIDWKDYNYLDDLIDRNDAAYFNKEYINQQLDNLNKRIGEAQQLREELENNRKRLLQSIPPWLCFKETENLPQEFAVEVRQHLSNYISNLTLNSVGFNVLKILVAEDEKLCQIINEVLNNDSFNNT